MDTISKRFEKSSEMGMKILRNIVLVLIVVINFTTFCYSQNSSPANWLYPDGNLQATKYIAHKSNAQDISKFSVKWSTPYISGDVKPLIGNIVNNPALFGFPYSPNEIVAIMGEKIVLMSGTGSLLKSTRLPIEHVDGINAINAVSCLIDTSASSLTNYSTNAVVLGMSTGEISNPKSPDSLAYAYIFGYKKSNDSIMPLKRLAVNLRPYSPNIFASVTPFYGKSVNGKLMVYATVNMSKPKILDPNSADPQFFRGISQFYDKNSVSSFPLPDIADDINFRVHVGAEVNNGQPSLMDLGNSKIGLTFPSFPTTKDIDKNFEALYISSSVNGEYIETFADIGTIVSLKLDGDKLGPNFLPYEITPDDGIRPLIKSYFVDLTNNTNNENGFILVTEEYSGTESSIGMSKLHLFSKNGTRLTDPFADSPINPYIKGGTNHYWSVAVGNVDGNEINTWKEFFPNNIGKELIVTQSTKDFVYPGSKLSILRYRTGADIPKPSPNGDFLFELDTICTQRIDGWVAAANDIDGAADNKDEIFLVNGSRLVVVRMKDYSDVNFRLGRPLDTLFTMNFNNQTISNVAISDLEGDGKNDIIVTTFDSTYILGSSILNTLYVLTPKDSNNYLREYCAGDTVDLQWYNAIYGQTHVNLRFIKYLNGYPVLDTSNTIIIRMIVNNSDTVKYKLVVDSALIGKAGKIIVEGAQNPTSLFDTTTVLRFIKPSATISSVPDSVYFVGERIKLTGDAICADSLAFEYQSDSVTWNRITYVKADINSKFNLDTVLPCILNRFKCDANDNNDSLIVRIIALKSIYRDTLPPFSINIRPARFPVKLDTAVTANPSKEFTWNPLDINKDYGCTNLSISFSADYKTFYEVAMVPVADGKYLWNVPIDLQDTLIVRFCCENSCVRTDTLITGMKPKYIGIIAPNPFNPVNQTLEIVYKVPQDVSVTIKIIDHNNRLVAEPVKNVQRRPNIAYSDQWDGRLSDNSQAANGMYYVVLELSNGAREIYPLFIKK